MVLYFRNNLAFEVELEAQNGQELLSRLSGDTIDILLLDLQMPGLNGYDTCVAVHQQYPKLKILAVSHITTLPGVVRAVQAGVHGFFSKYSEPDDLLVAITQVMDDHFYLDPSIGFTMKDILSFNKKTRDKSVISNLFTEREISILKMACLEFSSLEIADKLFINVKTVDTHRKRIMEKTSSKNFIGAILYAIKHNYISLPN